MHYKTDAIDPEEQPATILTPVKDGHFWACPSWR